MIGFENLKDLMNILENLNIKNKNIVIFIDNAEYLFIDNECILCEILDYIYEKFQISIYLITNRNYIRFILMQSKIFD
jgi:hypothetical protein